ncbi:MAG TPA: PVC-type heme-binding CxxCH protein [Chthoniobacteraceae bacterium]|jgi:putative membrane-bound dehydrogenase-like protein|nr:PVC-type heme-binding CxxCH protein [Chthoniobacteraceae bacterium]
MLPRFPRFLWLILLTLGWSASVWAQEAALLEGETLHLLNQPAGTARPQEMRPFGDGGWSANRQLWWSGVKPGDVLELALPVTTAGTYRLGAGFTKAVDYGIFDVSLDGKKIAGPLDFYSDSVKHTAIIELGGALELTAGEHRLSFTITGANSSAVKKYMLGLDFVLLARGANADLAALGPKLVKSAPKEIKTGNVIDAVARTPEEERKAFTLPEGFTIELVASEETGLPKPTMCVFDNAGRLWSATATEYPRDKEPGIWSRPGKDRVVIFDHPCARGPQTPRTFADGMVMPLSVLPSGKGAYVAQGPEIFYLDDTDGDGKADARKVLLHGFGVQDTHTLPHQLAWMPGRRIVYSQGVLNSGKVTDAGGQTISFNKTQIGTFRPDGTGHEVIGAGMNNIWSWALSREGRVFIHEANDYGYSVVPFEEDSTYPSFVDTKLHPATPIHPPTAQGLDLGGTGFCGLALCDGADSFPAPWRGCIFVSNPVLGRVHAVSMEQGADGVYAFKKAGDLVQCSDPMFRPISVVFGPDGCLYIADWYNRIISHNEVARDHPGRDKTHGRLWRVRHVSQSERTPPDLTRVALAELPAHLTAANTWEMHAAWQEIATRGAKELAPALEEMIRNPQTADDTRIHAIWSLEDLGQYDAKLWSVLLANRNPNVRHEAVRALGSLKVPAGEAFALLQPLAGEEAWTVRYEVLRYFRRASATSEQLAWLHRWSESPADQRQVQAWKGPYLALGGPYERAFQDFLFLLITDKNRAQPASDPRWDQVVSTQPARSATELAAITKRVAAIKTALAVGGDHPVDSGRAFVEATCLACHQIATKGVPLAPPLDGSASRDLDGLITSIVDPDGAIENVFRLYRVEKKDGTSAEGFRKNVDEKQLTLMFMGGTTQTISLSEVKTAGYVQGKSVMPPLAAGLSDEQVTDVVRFLRTVK